MKNMILFSATLLLCAALAIAQDTPQPGSSNTSQPPAASSPDQANTSTGTTVQGCLSGTSGNYMLTDANGMMYQLTGDESQLSTNVNKEVEVIGTIGANASASPTNNAENSPSSEANGSARNSGTAAGASASANTGKTLQVTSIKKVADSCSTSK